MAAPYNLMPWLDQPHEGEYRSYTDCAGAVHYVPVRYPQVTATPVLEAAEELPGLFHTAFALDGFHFCDRIDLYAVGNPQDGGLLVDTGHYDLCSMTFLDDLAQATGGNWANTEIFLTHLHDDHAGNVPYALHQGARRVYRGSCQPFSPQAVQQFLTITGARAAGDAALDEFAAFLLGDGNPLFESSPAVSPVNEGDAFDRAGFHLEVLDTPGHTAEHRCLIDRERGILFTGDHLIFGAPGVMQLQADQHLLSSYLSSMASLRAEGLQRALLSHHEALASTDDINRLIDRIIAAHQRPLDKTAAVLQAEGPATVYAVTAAYDAARPGGLAGQPRGVRARRVATLFGYLDYLVDTDRARRHTDDDGALVYEAI